MLNETGGAMKIQWMGHASFLLETTSGVTIVTDPYQPGCFDGAVGYDPINVKADIITVSHQHADHNYVQGFKEAEIIDKVERRTIKDVKIEGILSYHDKQGGCARGENIIFLIQADNLKIVHFGDLGTLDVDYSKLQNIDIAFMPVGGVFTLDAVEATELMNKISPKILIPMHFKTPKLAFDIADVEPFLKGKKGYDKEDEINVTPETTGNYKPIVMLKPQR